MRLKIGRDGDDDGGVSNVDAVDCVPDGGGCRTPRLSPISISLTKLPPPRRKSYSDAPPDRYEDCAGFPAADKEEEDGDDDELPASRRPFLLAVVAVSVEEEPFREETPPPMSWWPLVLARLRRLIRQLTDNGKRSQNRIGT